MRPRAIVTVAIAAIVLISAAATASLLLLSGSISMPFPGAASAGVSPGTSAARPQGTAPATSAPAATSAIVPASPATVPAAAVLFAGTALGSGHTGPFTTSTKIPGLGEAVTWEFSGGPSVAGVTLEIQATTVDFPVQFETLATVTADADGTAYWTASYDHPAYLSVRAVARATARTAAATSHTRIASWRGHGACPAQVSGPVDGPTTIATAAGPNGATYAVRAGWTPAGDEQTTLVATTAAGSWTYTFPACAGAEPPVAAADGTVYVHTTTRQAFTGGRLYAFGPSGLRATHSLSGLIGRLVRSPDGTVFLAAERETLRPASGWAGIWHASYLAALDAAGAPRAGWPYVSTVPLSDPSFASDGTVYLAAGFQLTWPFIPASATRRGSVIALRPNGSPLPGWPFTLPAGTAATITSISEGNDQLYPQPPIVAADGTVFVVATSGEWGKERDLVVAIGRDGRPGTGWPYATRLSRSGFVMATGGAPGAVAPAVAPDGTVYLVRTVGTAPAWHEEIVALTRNGSPVHGWPVSLPSKRTPALDLCPAAAGYYSGCWLRLGSGGELVLSLAPRAAGPSAEEYCLARDARQVSCPPEGGELLP